MAVCDATYACMCVCVCKIVGIFVHGACSTQKASLVPPSISTEHRNSRCKKHTRTCIASRPTIHHAFVLSLLCLLLATLNDSSFPIACVL